MKWMFALLIFVLLIIAVLGFIGAKVIPLPKTNDPFPAAIQTQLDALDDKRFEIEWLAAKVRMAGKANELKEEREAYDELANDANAWLKAAEKGLEANRFDTAFLTEQFERNLMPKAKALDSKLQMRMRWIKWELINAGFLQRVAAQVNHGISVLDHGWRKVRTYFELIRAGDVESRKIAMNQLDGMKWLPWTDLMGEM